MPYVAEIPVFCLIVYAIWILLLTGNRPEKHLAIKKDALLCLDLHYL